MLEEFERRPILDSHLRVVRVLRSYGRDLPVGYLPRVTGVPGGKIREVVENLRKEGVVVLEGERVKLNVKGS